MASGATTDNRRSDQGRGRAAHSPREIPGRGWRDVLLRTKDEISDDHISITAAGMAFYALLAIFPAIVAAVSLWALLADPQQVQQQIQQLSGILPQQAATIIQDQARKVASGASTGASLAGIAGVLFALYSASKGTKAMIEGLNIVYDEDEKRGFFMLNIVALALTLFLVAGVLVSIGVVMVLPAVLGSLGLGSLVQGLITWLRWPILLVLAMLGLGIIYRFAPSRDRARWQWVSWGAVAATLLWIAGSIAFSIYVRNFGSYNETYGTLGAVIILLLWLWLSSFVLLLGAELNAELERQTREDTTRGAERPMGARGAYAADTVGERR